MKFIFSLFCCLHSLIESFILASKEDTIGKEFRVFKVIMSSRLAQIESPDVRIQSARIISSSDLTVVAFFYLETGE